MSKSSSPLTISTSSLNRLIKDQSSYHDELAEQERRLEKLVQGSQSRASNGEQDGDDDDDDRRVERENQEWEIRQARQAIEETKAVFPRLRKQIEDVVGRLEMLIASEEQQKQQGQADNEASSELEKAKEVLEKAKKSLS